MGPPLSGRVAVRRGAGIYPQAHCQQVDEVFHCQSQALGSIQLLPHGCMHGAFGKAVADSLLPRIPIVP